MSERFARAHDAYLDPPWPDERCSICHEFMTESGATGSWRCLEECEREKARLLAEEDDEDETEEEEDEADDHEDD